MRFDLDRASAAWLIAGVPLVVTFVQTVFSLLDWTTESTGITALTDPVLSIEVMFEAAEVFKTRPALVVSLFLLITAAWVVQGLAMFIYHHRDAAFAAAGLAGVLYLVLFFGVYHPLIGMQLPANQLAGFFLIPFVATGLVGGAALTHDWATEILDEVATDVGALETTLSDRRSTFETEYRSRLGDLTGLEEVAPTGVKRAEEARRGFLTDCDACLDSLDELRSERNAEVARSQHNELRGRIESLDPNAAVDRIDDELRQRVISGVRTRFGDVQLRSRFDEEYRTANLPTRYRELTLQPWGVTVTLDQLGDALTRRAKEGSSIGDLSTAVSVATEHVDRTDVFISDHEANITSRIESVEGQLSTVRKQTDQLDGEFGKRVREVLVENRHDDLIGVRGIERELNDVLAELHDCQFSTAEQLLSEAEEDAQTLVTAAGFVRSISGRIEHESTRITIPAAVSPSLLSDFVSGIESTFDVDAEVRGTDLLVEYGGDREDGRSSGSEPTDDSQPVTGPGVVEQLDEGGAGQTSEHVTERPDEVLDAALFVFRELQRAARDASNGSVQYQTANLPSAVGRQAVLGNVERFLSNQHDLIRDVSLQNDAPPGFLEVTVAENTSPANAIRTVRDRYAERYG